MSSPDDLTTSAPPDPWVCLHCETLNEGHALTCEVCGSAEKWQPQLEAPDSAPRLSTRLYKRTSGIPGALLTNVINTGVIRTEDMTMAEMREEVLTHQEKRFLDAEPYPVSGILLSGKGVGLWVLLTNNKLTLYDKALKVRRKELFLSARGDAFTCFSAGFLLGAACKSREVTLRIYSEAEMFGYRFNQLTYSDTELPRFACINPAMETIAVITPGQRLFTWMASSSGHRLQSQPVRDMALREAATALCIQHDGGLIFVGCADGVIQAGEASGTFPSQELKCPDAAPVTVLLSGPGAEWLYAGTGAGMFCAFRPGEKKEAIWSCVFDGPITSIALSPDGAALAVAAGFHVHLLDTATFALQHNFETQMDELTALILTNEGTLYAGGKPGNIDRWEQEAPAAL